MFASSPRPAKKIRTNADTPEKLDSAGTEPRATRSARSLVKEAPNTTDTESLRNSRAKAPRKNAILDNGSSNSDFVDSAYQSMGTSPDNGSFEVVETPTRKSKRTRQIAGTAGDLRAPIKSALGNEGQGKDSLGEQGPQEHESPEGSSNAEDTIIVRASGRERKKTRKVAEVGIEEISNTARKRGASRSKITDVSQTAPVAGSGSIDPARPASLASSAQHSGIARGKLKMPSKRNPNEPHKPQADLVDENEIIVTPSKKKSLRVASAVVPNSPTVTPKKSKSKTIATPSKSKTPRPASTEETTPRLSRLPSKSSEQELATLLGQEKYREVMTAIRDQAMSYITASELMPLCGEGHNQAYQKVYQVLEQTISAGEGNSMLLIGARGTAKTNIVNVALSELGMEFANQFHTIRLNGFLHTDDKLALKEIWRQLGKEMAIEDDTMNNRGNYADTLASLLALLSQPEELSSAENDRTTSKSVIFILDEFDLFTTHPRQTLLYNLFDIAQSRKAPIAVLGVTTRIDAVESLEKRVKSRFSHRYVHVTHPKSFSAYTSIIKTFLLASYHDEAEESSSFIKSPALDQLRILHADTFLEVYKTWSGHINSLLIDPSVHLMLNQRYNQTKSAQDILNSFLLPLSRLPSNLPTISDLLTNRLTAPDSNLHLLPSLSDASLALLISAARLDIICSTDTVTFNMAYDEYTRLAQRSRLVASSSGMFATSSSATGGSKSILGRDVALAAWEILEEIGLLLPITGQGGYGQSQGSMVDLGRGGRLVRVDVGVEEIAATPGVELGSMAKWCKEI